MPLGPAEREKLDKRGIDLVRALLISHAGPDPGAAVTLQAGVYVNRSDVEDWLREREKTEARRIKTGVVAAIVGAIAAIAAAIIALLAWIFPRGL